MKMRCARVRRKLPLLIGGELVEPVRVRVIEHLRQCPACARELSAYEDAFTALREAPAQWAKTTQRQGLWEAVRDATVICEQGGLPTRRTWARVRHLVSATLVAALVVVVALLWFGPQNPASHDSIIQPPASEPNGEHVTDLLAPPTLDVAAARTKTYNPPSNTPFVEFSIAVRPAPPIRYSLEQVRLVRNQEAQGF